MYIPENLIDLTDYEKYKRLSVELSDVLRSDSEMLDRALLIEHCGDFLHFSAEGDLMSANFCRQRLCPNCQRRRSLKTYSKFKQLSDELLKKNYVFIHLVLTCKNCEDFELKNTIDKLYASSSKLFKNSAVKRVFKGVLRCLEVSYSGTCLNYHPHLHCLIAVKKSYFTSRYYLKQDKLQELWKKALAVDYEPQIHVTRCDDNAIAEVSKYCVKPLEIDCKSEFNRLNVLKSLHRALHGRRLLQTYGVIREEAKLLNIDLESDDDSELEKVLPSYSYSYDFIKGKYTIT